MFDVVTLSRPLSVVHHGGQLQLRLDVSHAVRKHGGHGRPVDHRATATPCIHPPVLGVEPGVELPVSEGHTDAVMVRFHLWQHLRCACKDEADEHVGSQSCVHSGGDIVVTSVVNK